MAIGLHDGGLDKVTRLVGLAAFLHRQESDDTINLRCFGVTAPLATATLQILIYDLVLVC